MSTRKPPLVLDFQRSSAMPVKKTIPKTAPAERRIVATVFEKSISSSIGSPMSQMRDMGHPAWLLDKHRVFLVQGVGQGVGVRGGGVHAWGHADDRPFGDALSPDGMHAVLVEENVL